MNPQHYLLLLLEDRPKPLGTAGTVREPLAAPKPKREEVTTKGKRTPGSTHAQRRRGYDLGGDGKHVASTPGVPGVSGQDQPTALVRRTTCKPMSLGEFTSSATMTKGSEL